MDGKPHILVVDDDSELRALLSDFLMRNGYRVSLAQNGAAMPHTLKGGRVSISSYSSITMPGEDGLSLYRRLRVKGTLPIIMITAKGREVERILGLEMGADDYLAKPFSLRKSCSPGSVRCCAAPPYPLPDPQSAPALSSSSPAGASM